MEYIKWESAIEIIKQMFEIGKDKVLANYLGVKPHTISRLKNAVHLSSSDLSPAHIYKRLFDPTNPQAPASEIDVSEFPSPNRESQLLARLIEILTDFSDPTPKKIMQPYFTNTIYKKFVMILLENTRNLKSNDEYVSSNIDEESKSIEISAHPTLSVLTEPSLVDDVKNETEIDTTLMQHSKKDSEASVGKSNTSTDDYNPLNNKEREISLFDDSKFTPEAQKQYMKWGKEIEKEEKKKRKEDDNYFWIANMKKKKKK